MTKNFFEFEKLIPDMQDYKRSICWTRNGELDEIFKRLEEYLTDIDSLLGEYIIEYGKCCGGKTR